MLFCCCCWVAAEFKNEKDGLSEYILQDTKRKNRNKNFQKNKRERRNEKERRNINACGQGGTALRGGKKMRMLLVKPISVKFNPKP